MFWREGTQDEENKIQQYSVVVGKLSCMHSFLQPTNKRVIIKELWHQIGIQKYLLLHVLKMSDTNLGLQGKGKFINRPTSTGGKKYNKYFVYIPTEIANDSQFPFKIGEVITIQIDYKSKKVIISK